ncbi:MAG: glycerophosphodiester phosphodiesterase family protein [Eubacteriales bacterium]|nr:glycerophosphodiester phosphodiesterase family protein [Eubacteriales bacterium]
MRKKLLLVSGILLRSWDTLICFEILYKTLGHSFVFPYIRSLLESIPRKLGFAYLSQQNIGLVLRSPAALLTLAAVLLLLAFYLLFETVALLEYCEAGWRRQRIMLWGMCKRGLTCTAGLFRPKRVAVLLFLPALLLSVFSFASGWLRTVHVPEFILEHIWGTPPLALLYAVVLSACNLMLFCYMFGLPSMLLGGASFPASCRESRRLLKGKKLRLFGGLLWGAALLLLVFSCLTAIAVLISAGYAKLAYGPEQGRALFRLTLLTVQRSGGIAAGVFASVLLCAAVLTMYHAYRGDARPKPLSAGRGGWGQAARRTAFVVFSVMLLVFAGESELGGAFSAATELRPKIVAHRAGGAFAPENTVAALEQAIADGADEAEIDVQQLRDGTLIVLHDTNFKRTAGLHAAVWDTDYAAVKELDNGSYFSPAYAGEPVATLDEMLRAAKGRIGLMIELKATGHERALEQETLALIRSHGMEGQCGVASMNLDILRRVKAQAPEIQTVYISAILISDRYDLQFLDGYSVETTSLSAETVSNAHMQGKKVYGWTANTEKNLAKLLRYGVDGVLTDNVLLAQYAFQAEGENMLVDWLTGMLFPDEAGAA